MKKIFYICTITAIIGIFIFNSIYNMNFKDSINIGNFLMKEQLNKSLIDKYLKSKNEDKSEIENHIKSIVIKDMNLDEWSEYIEDIKMTTHNLDIVGDGGNEFLISLNLSKNLGVIGIYKLEGDNYSLYNKVDNLTNVKKIEVKMNKSKDKKYLILEEVLDQRVGAYFTDTFVRILTEIDGDFKEVFKQSIDYEAYYYEKWINPNKESSLWFKLNEKSIIEYSLENNKDMKLNVKKQLRKFEGKGGSTSKIPSEFKEIEKKDFDIKYTWDEEYKAFILGKGKIIETQEEVAILEDISKTVDYLLNLGDKYYKVINKNTKIKYVKENEIEIEKTKDK